MNIYPSSLSVYPVGPTALTEALNFSPQLFNTIFLINQVTKYA